MCSCWLRTILLVSIGAVPLVSCSGSKATRVEPTEVSSSPRSSGSGSGSASDAEIRALVTEVLSPQLCPKLIGAFIGLPGESNVRGPSAGTVPAVGRWWIRRCNARVINDRLELSLGGPGWNWVDRETSGFRVRQYVLFEADAQLSADVTVGYDPVRRIASLWMTPVQGVAAHVTPRGVITPEPTGLFTAIVGGVLPLAGVSVSDRARAEAERIGSEQMRERLGAGFTMTVALERGQVDFMVGALARGEVPERPYPSDTSQPWQINQRSMVWPGGLDVVGPVDLSGTPQGLDVELEEGEGVSIRTVCAEALTRYLDVRFRDPGSRPAAPSGSVLLELSRTGARHVVLPTANCPTLLVIAPRPDATLPVRLRYRVAPEGATAVVNTSGSSVAAMAPAPSRPQRVRIQVVGVTVSARNASGHDWDIVGGEADVYVVTASIPLRRQIDRTPSVQDRNTAQWNRWLPGAYELSQDLPLRFTVFDEDATSDEVIGTADLEASAVPASAAEVSLPVRTTGAVPVQTGTLRLRIEPVP